MVCRRRRSECLKTLRRWGQFWNEELEQLWGLGTALWHRLCGGRLLAVAFGWGSACIWRQSALQGYGVLAVMQLFKFGAEKAFCSTYGEVWGKLNDRKMTIGEHLNLLAYLLNYVTGNMRLSM